MDIAKKSRSSCVNEGNAKTNTDFVDVVSGIDIVKCQNDKMELLEEVDRHLSDVWMVSNNIEVGINFCQCLFGGQSFRFAFMLFFEQKLTI